MTAQLQLDSAQTRLLSQCLSRPRFARFCIAADHNEREALRLYGWNIELSGAVHESLHFFEVVLRNSMDEQLRSWNQSQVDPMTGNSHGRDWLTDPSRLLERLVGKNIRNAQRQSSHRPRDRELTELTTSHDDVLSQLSLGTWRFLLPDRDPGRQLLWDQALWRAFPHLGRSSAELVRAVDGVYRLRNRVAHLEPLLNTGNVSRQLRQMIAIVAEIEPVAATWLTSRQRVSTVLRKRPQRG
jgi:hypothetical protein